MKKDLFDKDLFRAIRTRNGAQSDWASMVGVSQGTIGNWERGITYPNKAKRRSLVNATRSILEKILSNLEYVDESFGLKIDPLETRHQLESSILKASLTDFNFSPEINQIIPIPFSSDTQATTIEELERDRKDLLEALADQSIMIVDGLSRGANTETARLIEYLEKYREQCTRSEPNPRLLHRIGETIAKRTAEDDVRSAISGWDDEAIDGFNSDHIELMRLYYRAALARAQEVETAVIEDSTSEPSADDFYSVAEQMDLLKDENGEKFISDDIPTLLRDIGREIRDLSEAEMFTFDDRRRAVYRRRRREAIKNASIYVGRFVFFTSLFVVITPAVSLGTVGSIASIIGLMEAASPGTIVRTYERLREAFPVLPRLPRG